MQYVARHCQKTTARHGGEPKLRAFYAWRKNWKFSLISRLISLLDLALSLQFLSKRIAPRANALIKAAETTECKINLFARHECKRVNEQILKRVSDARLGKKSLAATRGIKRSDARRERTKFADDNKVERPLKTLEFAQCHWIFKAMPYLFLSRFSAILRLDGCKVRRDTRVSPHKGNTPRGRENVA